MCNFNRLQLELNFPVRTARKESPASRILRNMREIKRREYFAQRKEYRVDKFMAVNGMSVY